jgi:hypothetical protein
MSLGWTTRGAIQRPRLQTNPESRCNDIVPWKPSKLLTQLGELGRTNVLVLLFITDYPVPISKLQFQRYNGIATKAMGLSVLPHPCPTIASCHMFLRTPAIFHSIHMLLSNSTYTRRTTIWPVSGCLSILIFLHRFIFSWQRHSLYISISEYCFLSWCPGNSLGNSAVRSCYHSR